MTTEEQQLIAVFNQSFLIGGMVVIVFLAILWFTVLRKKTTKPYPIIPMLSVAFVAQAVGLVAFFS
jgi:hypothetical protein